MTPTVTHAARPIGRPEALPRQGSDCHIVCVECGNAADVTLEALAPASLRLRCLDCLGDVVMVLERPGSRAPALGFS